MNISPFFHGNQGEVPASSGWAPTAMEPPWRHSDESMDQYLKAKIFASADS